MRVMENTRVGVRLGTLRLAWDPVRTEGCTAARRLRTRRLRIND